MQGWKINLWGFAPTPTAEKDSVRACNLVSQPWNTSKGHQVPLVQIFNIHYIKYCLLPSLEATQMSCSTNQNSLSGCFEVMRKPLFLQDWQMSLAPLHSVFWGSGRHFSPSQGSRDMNVHLSFFTPPSRANGLLDLLNHLGHRKSHRQWRPLLFFACETRVSLLRTKML